MSAPLLETKLFLPRPRRGRVPRPRLRERLRQGLRVKLMLVSAPAGFGKTTLLVDWMAAASARRPATRHGRVAVAWTTRDNDPATFWTYVIAALRTAAPGIGAEALGLLQDRQPPPVEIVLTIAAQRPQRVRSRPRPGARRLPRHRQPGDPRGSGVPARPPAAAAAPGHRQPRRPAPAARPACAPAASWSRCAPPTCASRPRRRRPTSTTPWACQLSADDVSALGGPHRGLDRRPPARRPVDRRTVTTRATSSPASRATTATSSTTSPKRCCSASQTGRAVVPAADLGAGPADRSAVRRRHRRGRRAGDAGGLDRDNLFLVPLDDNRRWYRYHHLFADVLRARLLDEQPQDVAGLHRPGQRVVRAERRPRRRRSGTRSPGATSRRRPT